MYDISKFNPKNPKFVVYILTSLVSYNDFLDTINLFNNTGINVIILSFIYFDNANLIPNLDNAIKYWCKSFTPVQRQNLKNAFNGVILVSHGGQAGSGSIVNYNDYGIDKCVKATWDFISFYNLDGVDIDYETSNGNVALFSEALAKAKPKNYLYTMAPQASGATLNQHRAIYKNVGYNIDWFNLQCYFQNSDFKEYCYTMIDSSNTNANTSIRGIITGKCLPGNNRGCPIYDPIPAYKIVIGACVNSEAGNLTPNEVAEFIVQASKDENGYFTDWFKGGGMMIWEYWTNPGEKSSSAPDNISIAENKNIICNINRIKSLFYNNPGSDPGPCIGSGPNTKPESKPCSGTAPPTPTPTPTPTPGPTPTPTPTPTPGPKQNKCQNINCNKYGVCDENTGKCVCNYGYSGNNCEKLPICNKELKNINDDTNVMKDKFSSTNLTIGIILICIAILIFVFYIFYKIFSIFIGGIILFIIGIILISYYSTNKNYRWNTSQWSNCNNNKQTRIVTCIDKNKNISSDTNCILPKPIYQQDCNKTVTMCNCGSNYTCLQKNGQPGKKNDNLCVECQS